MEEQQKSGIISNQNLISLVIGILTITVTLYIYFSSKKSASLKIEQLSTISYVSQDNLIGDYEFELKVNGEEVKNLITIPFKITNNSKLPISSDKNSDYYNLMDNIVLNVDLGSDTISKIISIQNESKSAELKLKRISKSNIYNIEISLNYINPNDYVSFSLLINTPNEPTIKLSNNPLIGGTIDFYHDDIKQVEKDFIYQFKYIYFINFIAILLLVQFFFVVGYLIYQARILILDKKQSDTIGYGSAEYKKQEKEQQQKIDERIEKIISENISKNDLNELNKKQLPVPKDSFLSNNVESKISLDTLLKIAFKREWEWSLKDEFPIEIEQTEEYKKSYYPQWMFWDDYFKNGVLLLGIISLILGATGYILLFG